MNKMLTQREWIADMMCTPGCGWCVVSTGFLLVVCSVVISHVSIGIVSRNVCYILAALAWIRLSIVYMHMS